MKFDWKKCIICKNGSRKPDFHGIGPVDSLSVPPLLLTFQPSVKQPLLVVYDAAASAETARVFLDQWAEAAGYPLRTLVLPDGVRNDKMVSISDSARARTLHSLLADPPDVLFASVAGLLNPVPSVREMRKRSITLRTGEDYSLTELARNLAELDYDDEFQVMVPGEFSRRGGLIDVFSPSAELPARIEFFGDTIDSIRLFSPGDQRSLRAVNEYEIIVRSGSAGSVLEQGSFADYLADWSPVILPVFPETLRIQLERFSPDYLEKWENFLKSFGNRINPLYDEAETALHDDVRKPPFFALHGQIRKALPKGGEKAFSELARQWIQDTVRRWVLQDGYCAVFVNRNEKDAVHFRSWLEEAGLSGAENVTEEHHTLPGGLFIPEKKTVILTELEIFSAPVSTRIANGAKEAESDEDEINTGTIDSAADLEEGDYAVHLNYGICIYKGLKTVASGGVKEEMIALEFADDMTMHVPMLQAHLLSRYVGAGKGGTKLSSVHSSKWGKTKADAVVSIRNLAYDMLRMQALRTSVKGTSCNADGLEQRLFEQAFPFQETPDQLKSANEIKKDMESGKPMDRLLCGDVGYGKTEVAMRAAFKCVMSGRQVAVLVPTTVLAQQHYYSFMQRFAGTPVIIEQLSRFRTRGEQNRILERMREGSLDIVIGTHRLVQDDVSFKNLGLIIIDEEQRFGVAHKEKQKKLRASVDVLTMTATPIPRTLYLSMAGLRDMSTIMSAPVRRLPVQTLIVPDEPAVVRAAVARELERGGQVYYVHNRVKGIESEAAKLQVMFPRARIGIGHGQMPEEELENVMSDFIENKLDILVCTTIIESGLDIPNANTIIIDRADRFGLAELYQLRGRVGRWTRQAYACLLLPRSGILTGDAKKRIAALRRYTHLGAGFHLAMSDLQIRGSGNILGAEQSGEINAIGFHLYCELLRDFTAQLNKTEVPVHRKNTEIRLDFVAYSENAPENKLPAVFSESYIADPKLRFQMYRRLSMTGTEKELNSLREELQDRFGKLPREAVNLLDLAGLRILASAGDLDSVMVYDGKAMLERGKSLVKPGGIVPRVPDIMTPEEKVLRLYQILNSL